MNRIRARFSTNTVDLPQLQSLIVEADTFHGHTDENLSFSEPLLTRSGMDRKSENELILYGLRYYLT